MVNREPERRTIVGINGVGKLCCGRTLSCSGVAGLWFGRRKVVVNMMCMPRTHCCNLKPLLDEALQHVAGAGWSCSISHVYREANYCADHLAALGHQSGFQWTVLEIAPICLRLALDADCRGIVSHRVVR